MAEALAPARGAHERGARVDAWLWWGLRLSLRCAALAIPLSIAASQIAVGVTLACWLALRLRTGGPRWPRTRLDRPILAFLAAGLLSAAVGLDPLASLEGLHTYLWVILFYAVVALVPDDRERRLLIALLLAGLFLSSYHRLANRIYNDSMPLNPPHPWMMPDWLPGKMTRANQLLLGLPLAHALWIEARGWKARLGLGAVVAMLGTGLVTTLKRAASVAAVVALAIQWWFRRRWMVAVLVGLSLVVAVGYEPIWERFTQAVWDFRENPDNRGCMWTIGWHLLEDHPLGIGTDNGGVMREMPGCGGAPPPDHSHFHSNPINIAVENGWLGLAAWSWWMGVLLLLLARRARAARDEGPFPRAVAMGALTGVVGWHLSGLTEFTFGDSEVMLALFLVTGLALGQGPELARDEEAVDAG